MEQTNDELSGNESGDCGGDGGDGARRGVLLPAQHKTVQHVERLLSVILNHFEAF